MHVSQLKDSKFLKQDDVGEGVVVTIKGCHEENVAKEGAEPEMKWCMTFHEQAKPLVLNSTNGQILAKIFGSDNSDDWTGKKVELYRDPNVSFGGKLVGGIRCRAPRAGMSNPGGADPAIVQILTSASRSGLTALQQAWQMLTNLQKLSVKPLMPKLKADALARDTRGDANEDFSGGPEPEHIEETF